MSKGDGGRDFDEEGTERMPPAPRSAATEEDGAGAFAGDSLIAPEALMPPPDDDAFGGADPYERRDTDKIAVGPTAEGASDTGDAALPAKRPEVLEPDYLIGSYRILRWLGSGGIGEVYEAEHVYIGRRVALKVLRKSAAEDEDTVQRFFDEARVTNRVRHPNIIDVTDLVFHPGEAPFIVMELLHGRDLSSELARAPLPRPFVTAVGHQVASALAALHQVGVVHRDLKPANVFLVGEGETPEVRLIDFGVAKVLERDATINHAETRHGAIVGTLDYLSPEQVLSDDVGPAVDVFALGIVLHEMATGTRPWRASNIGELAFLFTSARPTAEGIADAALRALVLACLSLPPDERPSMEEVAARLAEL